MPLSETIFQCDTVDRIVFHYNKFHNQDKTIPPWIIKHKGKTYYINHLDMDAGVGFSTKETPESEHTKGAIQFKGKLKIEKQNGNTNAKIY